MLQTGINGDQHVELLLSLREERAVFQSVPSFIVNSRRRMVAEVQLDTRVYAKLALGESSTVSTCSRVIGG